MSIYRNEEAGSEQEIVDVALLKRASRASSRRNRENHVGTAENVKNQVVEENSDSDGSWQHTSKKMQNYMSSKKKQQKLN